jgi:hypothetical protein
MQSSYHDKESENLAMNSPLERQSLIKTQESADTEEELAAGTPSLNTLYPKDERDLDALFPEPEVKQLFIDVAANLKRVNRFVSRMEQDLTFHSRLKKDKSLRS